jgi:hypothetical protein
MVQIKSQIYLFICWTGSNDKVTDELERIYGNCGGVIEVLSRHFPEGTEENKEKFPLEQPASRPRFEPSTSNLQLYSIITSQPLGVTDLSQWPCRLVQQVHSNTGILGTDLAVGIDYVEVVVVVVVAV